MKKIENLLLKACGYTILILILFYAVAFTGFTTPAIQLPTFLLILVFGIVISAAGMILYVNSLKPILRVLIHYAVMLVSFFIVFILGGKLHTGGSSTIFAAIILFTFLYALIFAIVYFIRRAVISADKAIDKKSAAQSKRKKKKPYTPLYK